MKTNHVLVHEAWHAGKELEPAAPSIDTAGQHAFDGSRHKRCQCRAKVGLRCGASGTIVLRLSFLIAAIVVLCGPLHSVGGTSGI
jgi:hypothetical protein